MKKQKRKKYELHLTFTKRQMEKIREEVAYRMGFIDHAQLMKLADCYSKSGYGAYLKRIK